MLLSQLQVSLAKLRACNADRADRPSKRRPFTSWVKRLATRKNNTTSPEKKSGAFPLSSKYRRNTNKNSPYPALGYAQRQQSARSSEDGALSFATSNAQDSSIRSEALAERDGNCTGKRSAAPTVNTKAETLHSDAGHSKAATTTTAGAAGASSTFSSPNQSVRSLTTTLTTIQSTAASNHLSPGMSGQPQNPVLFSHQYPVSPASSQFTASAIPRHVSGAHAAASNVLSDDASIMTLASSSKRRRRSMDTDASIRAMAPSSNWGGSRESLPLSVLSSNLEPTITRPGIAHANTERASVYSSQGIASPVIAPDRSSYYANAQKNGPSDTKSLRSVNNLDARSQYDAKSINDGKSMDIGSLRGYEGSVRSNAVGHVRQDSIPNSIGAPLSQRVLANGGLSRRSSDWAAETADKDDEGDAEHRQHQAEESSHV